MIQQLSQYSGRFTLRMDHATFHKAVVPWLRANFGNKRGKKKDWLVEEAPVITQRDIDRPNKSWALQVAITKGYWCRVIIKHNRDAIAFLAKWGDDCDLDSQIIGCLKSKHAEIVRIDGQWEKIAPMVRWMHRNVQPFSWAMSGGFRGHLSVLGKMDTPSWEFYLAGDDAKIAFRMVKPN